MSGLLAARIAQPDMHGLLEWQVADALNAPDPTLPKVTAPVLVVDARQILMRSLAPDFTTTAWVAILLAAEDVSSPARKAALAVREAIKEATVIDMVNPIESAMVTAALDALVAAAIIDAQTRDALLSLSEKEQSWAEANGVEVTARAVGLARGGV